VCVGDYDNDGFEDLYVTYYGKNVLYHNNGDGTFTEVGEKAHVAGSGKAWGTGCAFVDYDRDGKLDLVVANYVDFDSATALAPGEQPSCMWKGIPVMCGPRGCRGRKTSSITISAIVCLRMSRRKRTSIRPTGITASAFPLSILTTTAGGHLRRM